MAPLLDTRFAEGVTARRGQRRFGRSHADGAVFGHCSSGHVLLLYGMNVICSRDLAAGRARCWTHIEVNKLYKGAGCYGDGARGCWVFRHQG